MNIGQNKGAESRILYMDDHLAVFNKAAGDICAEGRVERGEKCGEVYGMEDGAEHFAPCTEVCGTNGQIGENERDGPYLPEVFCENLKKNSAFKGRIPPFIHCFNRLDRPVSGCVLLVFNRSLIPLLQNQFTQRHTKNNCIKKRYAALLEGSIPCADDFELLEHYIRFDAKKQKAVVYDTEERKTKKARLLWRAVFCTDRYTLAEIELLTGRTHQIRAQLAHKGFHIKGDVKYGARRNDLLGGIRLHAVQLCFRHPLSNILIDIHAPLLKTDALWDVVRPYLNIQENRGS